jgi:hypothetical protein
MIPDRYLNCPRCRLTIEVRPHRMVIAHCPRCIAHHHRIVELFSSQLPADVLYAQISLQASLDSAGFSDPGTITQGAVDTSASTLPA